MEIRYATSPNDVEKYSTEDLRKDFLVSNLFVPGKLNMVYSHYDRVVIGGAVPTASGLRLEDEGTFRTSFFLERRELGVVNIGGQGAVTADGLEYKVDSLACLYVGRGTKEVVLSSLNPESPAHFYLVSTPAHATYPTTLALAKDAEKAELGDRKSSNERTLCRYIHKNGVQSCQLMLGITHLHEGSMWNTMPAHLHDRRMEVYLYFGLEPENRVFHFMGEPTDTRHIVIANEQAVFSPSWSIHSGVGTQNYSFIWAMAGENYDFGDMDPVQIADMK